MKTSVFYVLLITVALAVSAGIYYYLLPAFVREGGPLVIALLTLTLMVITFVVERMLSLRSAEGRQPIEQFRKEVFRHIEAQDLEGALQACRAQRGSLATVLQAGIEKGRLLAGEGVDDAGEVREELQATIEDATTLELPLLEKNLVALATIASIATMVGLLGTVIGMIRSFRALAHAGAPDAVQLSIGISEALINTAGGLIAAITAIIAYNYFVTRIDTYTYAIDESGAMLVQSFVRPLSRRSARRRSEIGAGNA